MKFVRRTRKAAERWHQKAMLVDPRKTKITLLSASKPRHVPPWIYRKLEHMRILK